MTTRDASLTPPSLDDPEPADSRDQANGRLTHRQLRGSSLLLLGRFLSVGLNFLMQLLVVRYLVPTDYGAFAYALSIVTLLESVVIFGLDRSVTRFIPIYEEHGQYDRIYGTLTFSLTVVTGIGVAAVLLVIGLQGWLNDVAIGSAQATALLVILILLAPIHALDAVFMGMFAVFARARAIFFRKYVLKPALRLAVIGLLVFGELDVEFLAVGYVATGATAVVVFGFLLFRLLSQRSMVAAFRASGMTIPAREILGFTVPLLSSDLVAVVIQASPIVLLGALRGTAEVASLTVIQPLAMFNLLVFSSFTVLFTPAAARLFARGERSGVADLYWRTALWVAILTFPVFAATFAVAEPLTVLLYEERYAESAPFLALLSLGYYFNAALGFNGLTLKVFGRLRYIVVINLVAAGVSIVANLLLIPPLGATGAAIGTFLALVVHNVLKQVGLPANTGIALFERRHARPYAVIGAAAGGLLAAQLAMNPPPVVSVIMALGTSVVVVLANRRALQVGATFPELNRVPILRRLIAE